MTFVGGGGGGGFTPPPSTMAVVDEFICAGRVFGQDTTNQLMLKSDGVSPAELRPAQSGYWYSVYCWFSSLAVVTINDHSAGISHGLAYWNGTAWSHPSGTGIYENVPLDAGPVNGQGPKPDFAIDAGVGVIQIRGSTDGTLNNDHYQFGHVRIYGGPLNAANFPNALAHLP